MPKSGWQHTSWPPRWHGPSLSSSRSPLDPLVASPFAPSALSCSPTKHAPTSPLASQLLVLPRRSHVCTQRSLRSHDARVRVNGVPEIHGHTSHPVDGQSAPTRRLASTQPTSSERSCAIIRRSEAKNKHLSDQREKECACVCFNSGAPNLRFAAE